MPRKPRSVRTINYSRFVAGFKDPPYPATAGSSVFLLSSRSCAGELMSGQMLDVRSSTPALTLQRDCHALDFRT